MPRRILDTSVLIHHWRRRKKNARQIVTEDIARAWAGELLHLYGHTDGARSAWILTPIYIESLGGATSRSEIALYRAFLEPFAILDGGTIPAQDWEQAKSFAQRVPSGGAREKAGGRYRQAAPAWRLPDCCDRQTAAL